MRVDAPWLAIVGIGEDGMAGLGARAREALAGAELIAGSARTLALLDAASQRRAVAWPSPMMSFVDELLVRERGRAVAIVASGDPMFFGIGASIARRINARDFVVYPQPSSYALACARLGWPHEETDVISVVSRPLDGVRAALAPGRRLVVLSESGTTPAALARLLVADGYGASAMTVFEALGGPGERRIDGVAATWPYESSVDLNLVALIVTPADDTTATDHVRARSGCAPGLPDHAYEHDGALTKREIRAMTLARLRPRPGEWLWDIGAGSGSIGIEWMRTHRACGATAFERDAERAERIASNARTLGVPALRVVIGEAPQSLVTGDRPDAIFIGGGITTPGVLDCALTTLGSRGRLVANAVTLEAERIVLAAQATHGGELTRIAIERASPAGTMLVWRPAMPLVQWAYRA